MENAIITGTGIYDIPGFTFEERVIETRYGAALVRVGEAQGVELVFLARHGVDHTTPPHKINYQANLKALQMLGVRRILATNAVGSISRGIPPAGLAVLTDFLDFTSGRAFTYFDGGKSGLTHTPMDAAYCPALNARMLELAPRYQLEIAPKAVYVATNGPRFETPAEIRMYALLGGDVVGMTGVPEATLARELGMHYAALAYSINWAAGLEETITFVPNQQMVDLRRRMTELLVQTLREPPAVACGCEKAVTPMHPAEEE